MRKTCFKCHVEKTLDEFYRHKMMGDGHLNKCKECTKRDVHRNYESKREQYSDYERRRYQDPKRRADIVRNLNAIRKRYPEKAKAWRMVAYAKRTGKLIPKPCQHCGTTVKVQAHHGDYSKPLDVTWVCFKCHREHEHGQKVSA